MALLGARTMDSAGNRVFVLDEGGARGAVVWVKPDAGDEAYLGSVVLQGGTRGDFFALVAATLEDAVAEGFERAYFEIRDARLLALVKRTFRVEVLEAGWEPVAGPPRGRAVQWEIHVELKDARAQLAAAV